MDDRRRHIRQWAETIRKRLDEVVPSKPNEADFRRAIDPLLDEFCAAIGVRPMAHAEYTLATGIADAVFNRLVIEYERPGVLKPSLDAATRHSVQQVKDYLVGLAGKERQGVERLAGVAFDGCYFVFVRYVSGKWTEEPPVAAQPPAIERFLTWLAGLASGIALTSENLHRDFAIDQPRTQAALRSLFAAVGPALADSGSLVSRLFQQWRVFFSEAIDYSEAFGGRKLEPLRKWVAKAGFEVNSADEAERFFFVLHTYFALLVKLLGWLAVSRHLGMKLGAPSFAGLVTADGATLRQQLGDMESGGIFRHYGLLNLLEGDFFEWYLHAWNEPIEEAIRSIIRRLDEYDPTTLTVVPEETRDLFKKLYHYLLPREIRHNLGEYYTPDWLALRLLRQVDNEFFAAKPDEGLRRRLLATRFLDPACGSGTFLVLTIARMQELGRALMVDDGELLASITRNVVGFDLNPLAVLTARVNYLLAIAELIEHRRGEITIPVYLADSVRTPTLGTELLSSGGYEFPTAVGTFLVPAVVASPERFDRFCAILEASLKADVSPEGFLARVAQELALAPQELGERENGQLRDLYQRFLDLQRTGRDGLWARLLGNNFAPLTVGPFDYIVGNPPWVNWEHLPDNYRQGTKGLWTHYRLAGTFRGGRPRLGAVKVDISALMTYTVLDRLMKRGGRLGFVITQSLFKTGAAAGFRRFALPAPGGGEVPLCVMHVDDMVTLQPFEGAANRTAVMVIEKGRPTSYPVPYTVWQRTKRARFNYDSTIDEVLAATRRLNFRAQPVDRADATSPWLTARPGALAALAKVLGPSDYSAHAGCCTWANAVYWLEKVAERPDGLVVVRNIVEGAKVTVEETTVALEPDLLYPLLRGRDVQRWRAEPSAWILVPQDPSAPSRAYPEARLERDYPRTYAYLKQHEKILRERSGFRQILSRRETEFYGLMDIDRYTFAPWKVVWREVAQAPDFAVVSALAGRPVVADHTLIAIACAAESEAHYVSAVLSSSPARLAVCAYVVLHPDPHVIERVRVPSHRPDLPNHQALSRLALAAHEAAARGDSEELRAIEAEIDRQAARLWGLTDEELREIQASLREMAG